jgi:hypothetical protein
MRPLSQQGCGGDPITRISGPHQAPCMICGERLGSHTLVWVLEAVVCHEPTRGQQQPGSTWQREIHSSYS